MATRSAGNGRRPQLQSLESRCCPAVLFDFEAGVLRLTGDAGDNVVEIFQPQDRVLVVVGDGERQTFEGVDAVFASLGAGNDRAMSSKPKEIVVVGSKIKEDYDLGDGDDTLFIADRAGDVENKINMGGGNDSIWIDLGFPARVDSPRDFLSVNLVIDLGDGNDKVQARLENAGDVQLELLAGAGDDAVAVRANDRLRTAGPIKGWPSMEADIDLAAGDDRLIIETDGYGEVNELIAAGDGHDATQIRHRMFALVDRTQLTATLQLGAGDDAVKMEAANFLRAGATIDLGVGDDQFDGKYYITGVTHRFSHDDPSLGFAATLGAGRDTFRLSATGYDDVTGQIHTGPPGDRDLAQIKLVHLPPRGPSRLIDHTFDDGQDHLSLRAAGYDEVLLLPSTNDSRDIGLEAHVNPPSPRGRG